MQLSDWGSDGQMLLVEAIKGFQAENVEWLVEQGACVNCYDMSGVSPLQQAVELQNTDLIEFLIENGAAVDGIEHCVTEVDPDRKDFLGNPLIINLACTFEPPIFTAIRNADYSTYRELRALGSIWDIERIKAAYIPGITIYNFDGSDLISIFAGMSQVDYTINLWNAAVNAELTALPEIFAIHPELVPQALNNHRGAGGFAQPILNALVGARADLRRIRLMIEWGADPYATDYSGANAFDVYQQYSSGNIQILKALEGASSD